MAKLTTRVFDSWDALYNLVRAITFPVHAKTGEAPTVAFGDLRNVHTEGIVLPGRLDDRPVSTQTWATMGTPSKNERFRLDILLWTEVPGETAAAAHTRLKTLVNLIETALRNSTTGRPQGIAVSGVYEWQIADLAPAVYALKAEGFGAQCRLEVEFAGRI